ncbi:small integral membrane protein 14 [Lutzomyia longipalpis]|uniref:small integral membrane protein 14 n=1 Tax=Lutzomyia longipalpis TaxID=7200 RepID=UPI0024843838|nr:small integral membrane protein 14 [Lutzomyia longipalpis]XP_055688000.1 small integral membrane protein 14 [Lutzomyia longipalpis]
MGDEFDGCECIWSHEIAIRRLLTLLRQNQNYCTDTECIDLGASSRDSDSTGFTTMTMFIVFAVILFFMRPSSLRRNADITEKPLANHPGSDGNNGDPTVG